MDALLQSPGELQQLALQLLNEPCCRALFLEAKTLSEILAWLADTRDVPSPDAEFAESEKRFRATFHLFLQELEAAGVTGADMLSSIRLSDYRPGTETQELDRTVIGSIINLASKPAFPEMPQIAERPIPEWLPKPGHDEYEAEEKTAPAAEILPRRNPPPPPPPSVVKSVPEAFPTATHVIEDWASPGSARAREFYETALHLRRQEPSEGLPADPLARLEAFQLCLAIETETQDGLAEALRAFWPTRQAALKGLLTGPDKQLAAPLVQSWELQLQHTAFWPAHERLPLAAFRNSLRYLHASADHPVPVPSLIEAALWTYLFGQDLELDGIWLVNHLGFAAHDTSRVQDAFARLLRCHRLKAWIAQPAATVTAAHVEELREHAQALFAFWSR
ncbi:hypothetical protein K2X33_16405 [bacterium]|nr:hypothetical protein [bacterium]